MEESKVHAGEPRMGKVHEMCREWIVREDGALAYQLQSQEINDHYKHNKHKNAQVREDFPCALDEQLREAQLAEQAAVVYQKMLAEQEEIDNHVARELAERLEREERARRRLIEQQDETVARQFHVKESSRVRKHVSPDLPPKLPEKSPHRPDPNNYFANLPPSTTRRQGLPMPLPVEIDEYMAPHDTVELYTEPYKARETLIEDFKGLDLQEIGVPIDEVNERRIQEERDAELARKLQEQEGVTEEVLMNRDRMLAIEVQDKELAKLLQEKEKAKVRRARERAKQKALARKQMEEQNPKLLDSNQIMPDDSYAYPVDVIPPNSQGLYQSPVRKSQERVEEDLNYSFPLDVLPPSSGQFDGPFRQNSSSPQRNYDLRYQTNGSDLGIPHASNENSPSPVRPTHLDLRSSHNRISKPRFPDPEPSDSTSSIISTSSSPQQQQQQQLLNIAMAIDPTYPRKGYQQSPPSYDTTSSSTVTTSTSSSSPGMLLPPPDISDEGDISPVPPYMPIQGQRRTSSLEKKQRRKNKDGCRQQ